MKKFILGAILLFSTLTFSQETEFKFQKEGFTDFVVINIPKEQILIIKVEGFEGFKIYLN